MPRPPYPSPAFFLLILPSAAGTNSLTDLLHCILFNAPFDPVEKKWKAPQNYEMIAAQKFVENIYYHELARSLIKFGYQIENKPRGDFEIKGISPELINKFSKRHDEIDQKTRELLKREPEKGHRFMLRFHNYSRRLFTVSGIQE